MAWATPPVFSTGEPAVSTDMNTISGDLNFLYGDTVWNTPTFVNGWSGGAVFALFGRIVRFKGEISGGTFGSAAFTLPSGYRPADVCYFPIWDYTASDVGFCFVTSAGVLTVSTPTDDYCELDPVSFSVN